jgi:hypothetical protein
MTHLSKEEMAAQVLAVLQARFERPSLEDIDDILERAKLHARVAAQHGGDQPEPVQSRLRILRLRESTRT